VIPFKGIDEVAWVKDFEPKKSVKSKTPLILLREIENKAVYVKEKHDNNITLADQLAKLGDVRFINRYNIQGETFGSKPTFEDTLSIVASADLVVSYGGTISREAALLGIPSIAISDMAKTYVNKYLAKKGFPLFITTPKNVLTLGKRYLGKHFDVRSKLEELENPVDIIIKIIENLKVD
jgi:predicted glycosyltransferase